MFDECECGQDCPICEGCDKPMCECTCYDYEDYDESEEKDDW